MSVYERVKGSGNWYLYIGNNGKRIRKAIPEARNRRQAERAERVLRDEIFENRYGNGGQRNFAEFVETTYKPYAEKEKRGYNVELSILKVLIERFGKLRLCEVTPEAVEKFKRARASETTTRGTEREKSTVNRDLAVLSAVFNLAKDFGEVKNNPVSNIKFFKNLNSRDRVLSDEEEFIFFDYIRDDIKFSRQIEILLYTGFRRGELFKLEWRDVDLNEGYIHLRKEITKKYEARVMPMLSNVKAIFESLRREAGNIVETDKVFKGISSQPTELSAKFRRTCLKLGFKNLTVHSLRHTFSTRADEFKVGAFAQKDLLGHSKLSMTARYTHPKKETLKASLEPFEQHINHRNATRAGNESKKDGEKANLLDFKKK